MMKQTIMIVSLLATCLTVSAAANDALSTYEIWEPEPAPNRGRSQWERTKSDNRPNSYDRDWERWSYPIGNGYTGVSIFGRTDTERVQITDKTLHNKGIYGKGGLTSFAELFLDFNQTEVKNYRRSLHLNEAIAHVSYEKDGVRYQREYFASYQDNVVGVPDWKNENNGMVRKPFLKIPMIYSSKAHAKLTVKFTGTAIGTYMLAGPDAGVIRCTVDGAQTKEIETLCKFSGFNYPVTIMFFNELENSEHTLDLEILENRSGRMKAGGTALRVIGFTAN
jgi:hypothetical protein